MSPSRAGSFSVKISMPVACGAKTCTIPFFMFDVDTASCIWSVRSVNSISPFVEKLTRELTTLKADMRFTIFAYLA